MKKAIFILLPCLFAACSNTTTDARKEAIHTINKKMADYIKENANDPQSYEPISTLLVDSLSYMQELNKNLIDKKRYFDVPLSSKDSFAESQRQRISELQKEKDSLIRSGFKDFTISYTFLHECRVKNGFGGLIKTSFEIKTDQYLNIISIKER